MGILDGIVEWIAEQVMNILDLITTSVLGALGCSMDTFLRYFPAAETMYQVFLALGIGLILLNWVWQLFKNYFMGAGIEAEDPIKLSILRCFYITHDCAYGLLMLSAKFFVIFKNFLDQINSVMLADDLDETLHFLRDHSVDHFLLGLKWYQ